MRIAHRKTSLANGPSRQKGMVATLIALVVLIVTLLAVVALMHSVDTANTVAGSLTFRQGAMQEAERAYTDAKQLTVYTPPNGDNDLPDKGYYASVQTASTARPDIPALIYNQSNISNLGSVQASSTDTKTTIYYMVERLCPSNGAATTTTCIVPGQALKGGTSSNGTSDGGTQFNQTGSAAAFRLTVRVTGPKNAVAFVQTIMR